MLQNGEKYALLDSTMCVNPGKGLIWRKKKPIGFEAYRSRGYSALLSILREPISYQALSSLAFILSVYLNIKIEREYMRRKEMLIKWFDENLNKWECLIPHIRAEYILACQSSNNDDQREQTSEKLMQNKEASDSAEGQ